MPQTKLGPPVLTVLNASTAWSLMYQGFDPSADTGDYNAIPWRLGLLTLDE